MRTYALKEGENHTEYTLIETYNNFGDQKLKVSREYLSGIKVYVWVERSPEGSHRNIDANFLDALKGILNIK